MIKLKTITIPSEWKLEGYRFFKMTNGCLHSVQLPTTIRQINRKQIITLKQLTTYTIPSEVTKVDDYCFAKCDNLKELKGLEHVEEIGLGCFHYCPQLSKEQYPIVQHNIKHHYDLSDYQIQRLEDWTGLTCSQIVFHSESFIVVIIIFCIRIIRNYSH